jgi:hypothetical protein
MAKENEYILDIYGEETWRTSAGSVWQVPETVKLTDEIGTWAGDIHEAALPDCFLVDCVRVHDAI